MANPRWYEAPPGTVQTDFRQWEGTPPAPNPHPTYESSMARDYALFVLGVGILLVLAGLVFHFF